MKVTFTNDDDNDTPAADGWQPTFWGGPGAESILRQAPLFAGGLDRAEKVESPRADQRSLFPE